MEGTARFPPYRVKQNIAYSLIWEASILSKSSLFMSPSMQINVLSSLSSVKSTKLFTTVSVPTVYIRIISPESLASMSSSYLPVDIWRTAMSEHSAESRKQVLQLPRDKPRQAAELNVLRDRFSGGREDKVRCWDLRCP